MPIKIARPYTRLKAESRTLTMPKHAVNAPPAVDALMSPRPPQPTLDAIYLLTPTTQNVQRVIADFAGGRRTYRHVHLYFIDGELRAEAVEEEHS
jgi:syntaxin-binding protein 1